MCCHVCNKPYHGALGTYLISRAVQQSSSELYVPYMLPLSLSTFPNIRCVQLAAGRIEGVEYLYCAAHWRRLELVLPPCQAAQAAPLCSCHVSLSAPCVLCSGQQMSQSNSGAVEETAWQTIACDCQNTLWPEYIKELQVTVQL